MEPDLTEDERTEDTRWLFLARRRALLQSGRGRCEAKKPVVRRSRQRGIEPLVVVRKRLVPGQTSAVCPPRVLDQEVKELLQ
ncbi:hypothetical protein NDU88_003255 [Pleurodeles waltl]|uniref:Uncharacterized protein n=1 Tax=Pleurodeles waltl TaxID=8319 RepID=A0AAV7T5Y1_PLEWA|nr:hypothetical protein NDU88_003255 [Pleurodeles waltl]